MEINRSHYVWNKLVFGLREVTGRLRKLQDEEQDGKTRRRDTTRNKRMWVDNIKVDCKRVWDGVDWTDLA
jgi:hypothetical protein